MKRYPVALIWMVVIAIIFFFNVLYPMAVSSETARSKVANQGYTNIQIGHRHIITSELVCGEGYVVYFDFSAIAPNGVRVSGHMCKGMPLFGGWRSNF